MASREPNLRYLEKALERARDNTILIPTFAQMRDPTLVPDNIKKHLKNTGLWDVKPCNLFRITWKNEPRLRGGMFGGVNFLEFPHELTGVPARIIALTGRWFPTGFHKVGAAFGCLVPQLVTGRFDPTLHKAIWPSTGNFCRGGAYISSLLSCKSVAILPEDMSRERFGWLSTVSSEIVTTGSGQSSVRAVMRAARELAQDNGNVVIFDQFSDMGNTLWHYYVTGNAIEEAFEEAASAAPGASRLAALCLATGSAGTLSSGDYIKERYPDIKLAAAEPLQASTLLSCGHGSHRIEGISHGNVPWIHNVRNTDLVVGVDDEDVVSLFRFFNEPLGRAYLVRRLGMPMDFVEKLSYMGLSGIANLLACIKLAKYYEMDGEDIIVTVLTDLADMYTSRIDEMARETGDYTTTMAANDYRCHLKSLHTDHVLELTFPERKRIHNLKYFTWVEQQGKEESELARQWYHHRSYWRSWYSRIDEIDEHIREFNERSGVYKLL